MNRKALSPVIQEHARRLLRNGGAAFLPSQPTLPPAAHVVEALRRPLSALVGVNGFSVLLARALALAKMEAPLLSPVEVKPDGSLEGLVEIENEDIHETGIVLVTHLLGLLIAFIGERLTLRILSDVWPNFEPSHSASSGENEP